MIKPKKQKHENRFRIVIKLLGKISLRIFIAIICLIATSTVVNQIMLSVEDANIENIGQKLEIYENEYMNVYSVGSGQHTIVLLSGFGTVDPVIDFKKLADKLGENYKIAVVEYFGYGFSDSTEKTRTNENIMNETRSALKKAGLKPPYVLMPHSISGVYSMYYANKYPSEVEAIIGLDASTVSLLNYTKPEDYKMSRLYTYISKLGIARPLIYLFPDFCGYSNQISDMNEKYNDTSKYLTNKNFLNDTVVNEGNSTYSNELEINNLKYANNLPVLMILSQTSVDDSKKDPAWPAPKNWLELHEEIITNKNIQSIKIINGGHYIHWHNTNKIQDMTKEFIEKYLD